MAAAGNGAKIWTVLELMTWSTAYLQEKAFDEARLTVELLLAHALCMKRIQLYMNFDKPMTAEELAAFKVLLKRRLTHEPVQYIIGETAFMGLPFAVDARVLIPRPETETLVEEIVGRCKTLRGNGAPASVLDIGTGSGCIAVSCAKMLPGASVHATDCSPDAIAVATANAAKNGVDVHFHCADLFADVQPALPGNFDAVVSNPPYISARIYDTLEPEITEFEPRSAETDGADGLSFYRRLAIYAPGMLSPDGCLAVEHAYDQQADVMAILSAAGWRSVVPVKDHSGSPRCVIAQEFT